jgi:lipoprotein-anchoring transpeptidase ErfK/SrfK
VPAVNRNYVIAGGIIILVGSIFLMSPKEKDVNVSVQASSADVEHLYTQAQRLKKDQELPKAREVYQEIIQKYPEAENMMTIQRELEEINMNLLFSNKPVEGKTVIHEVVTGDTLGKIAKKYATTVELIRKSNNLKDDTIRVGQKIRVWTGQFNIYVDKSQNILILKDGNEVIKVYRVSTGENNSTPVGEFNITSKLVDPVWFHKGVVVPPESPSNVLGTRWLGFDIAGYGIHGTVDPDSIGQQVTAGCVRMRNQEVEELYSIVPNGTKVVIVD